MLAASSSHKTSAENTSSAVHVELLSDSISPILLTPKNTKTIFLLMIRRGNLMLMNRIVVKTPVTMAGANWAPNAITDCNERESSVRSRKLQRHLVSKTPHTLFRGIGTACPIFITRSKRVLSRAQGDIVGNSSYHLHISETNKNITQGLSRIPCLLVVCALTRSANTQEITKTLAGQLFQV
eukprot:sb/3471569/